jgi:tetratricopeptide (TPR) repeat protein
MECAGSILALVVSLLPPAAMADKTEERLHQANRLLNEKNFDEAIPILHAVAVDPKVARSDRYRAFEKIVELRQHQKRLDDAVAAMKEMADAFQGDDDLLRQIYSQQGNFYSWTRTDRAAAVEAFHRMAAHSKDDKESAVSARQHAMSLLQQDRKHAEVYAEAAELLRLLEGDPRAADALWSMVEARWQTQQYAECLDLARRIVAEFRHTPVWEDRRAHLKVVECLRKLDRAKEVRACYEAWEKDDPDPGYRQRWCSALGDCFLAESNQAAALAAFRRVIAGHCDAPPSETWYSAQNRIVDLLADSGDLHGALEQARIAFDASPSIQITPNVVRIAGLFARLDNDRGRADRYIAYQLHGPAGPDGKLGTDDDLTNPLSEIHYPADPERRQALAKTFAELGPDAAAAHHRGMLCLYAGQPEAALYYFMDAVRRCDQGKFQEYAVLMVVNGLRSVRGHSIGSGDALDYVLYGPNGPDGKSGTSDDLENPFAKYASFRPASPFAMPRLADRDEKLLIALEASLANSAADKSWPADLRVKALAALARVHGARDSWPQSAAWYRDQLRDEAEGKLKPILLQDALSSARGDAIHLGNVREFLASLAADAKPSSFEAKAEAAFHRDLQKLEHVGRSGWLMPKVKLPVKRSRKGK